MGAFVAEETTTLYTGACSRHTDWAPPPRESRADAMDDVYDHEEEEH